MMKKITFIFVFAFFSVALFAQNSNILMTVGDKKITEEEFSYIYKKNNSDNLTKQSLDEYLELFKKFKLKVIEAENLKMDTSAAFINELNGYRNQLAKPYLTENIKIEQLVKEAYERNKEEIKLDIIFIKLSKNASPEDTTLAYQKAVKIRDRILGGEKFEKVATETSDDRAVAKNKGHLSYLPALRIPYSIQNYVFKAKKDKVSLPLRTAYGYYLVKVVDKRPAQGFYKVAHIMISSTDQMKDDEKAAKKEKIDSIYNRILSGDKFEDLVKFSDDRGTAKKGGELPEFNTGKMVPEFEKAAFALKNPGDIGKPIKTAFGWHIIKLIDKRPPDSFEKQKEDIKKSIEKDAERKEIVKAFVISELKSEYNFKKLNNPDEIYKLVDSTVFEGKWKMPDNILSNKTLFTIGNSYFKESDFGKFIETKQKRTVKAETKSYVDQMYQDFIYESLTEVEKSKLEDKYSDFKFLMQEYHDGMLLFDLMKNEIWDKASNDSTGLKKFYDNNKGKYDNQIDVDISVFKYEDTKTYKEAEMLLNKSRKKYNDEKLIETIGDKLEITESGVFSKGENIYADKIIKMKKNGKLIENQRIVNLAKENTFIYINNTKKSKSKSFQQIKGVVISDYQTYLEEKWIKDLQKKYKITVNEKVLNNIKKTLK
ncbi:MAG: peptidylprolyl isomerase [Bacteroidales bacterium]|nr:peptidylprolyl isomerase [Bacteroidales bacterium]